MILVIDTNVLVRAAVVDADLSAEDVEQAARARALVSGPDRIVIGTEMLCEFVWVLRRRYHTAPSLIVRAIETMRDTATMIMDRTAVEAGLAVMRLGGDFADGVIARQGFARGADQFVSFDRKAVRLARDIGLNAVLV